MAATSTQNSQILEKEEIVMASPKQHSTKVSKRESSIDKEKKKSKNLRKKDRKIQSPKNETKSPPPGVSGSPSKSKRQRDKGIGKVHSRKIKLESSKGENEKTTGRDTSTLPVSPTKNSSADMKPPPLVSPRQGPDGKFTDSPTADIMTPRATNKKPNSS